MKKIISLSVKSLVTGFLLYFTLNLAGVQSVTDRFHDVQFGWILLGLLVLSVHAIVCSARWKLIARHCDCRLTFLSSFRFTMIATFFNQTLPSSVGGDAIRIWLLGKHTNWRAATYSVLLDRVVGITTLASLVLACLPWTLSIVRDPIGRTALLVVSFGCIATAVLFIALAWERLWVMQRWSLTRLLASIAKVGCTILRKPSTLASIYILSIANHCLTLLAVECAARSVGIYVPTVYLLLLVPPVLLISAVPISIAGWGIREGGMMTAFAYVGLPQGDGLVISLIFGTIYLLFGIAGGIVWIASSDRVDQGALSTAPIIE